MSRPAQTNIQLYSQLSHSGLSHTEESRLRNTYDLVVRLFPDRFCEDGRPYSCHLTGTASIVADQGGSVEQISAALLHSAYVNGDFGDGLSDAATPDRRATIRSVTGVATEELVFEAWRHRQTADARNGLLAAHRIEHESTAASASPPVFSKYEEDGEHSFRIKPGGFTNRHSRGKLAEPLCGDRVAAVAGVPDSIGSQPFATSARSDYAQTFPQLAAQLRAQGYTADDERLVAQTYELASEVFSGRFEQNGKVFLGHVVGTASLLASRRADTDTVAAALIHNIYRNGQFGRLRRGPVGRNRHSVAERTSRSCEEVVFGFYQFGFRAPEVNIRELSNLPWNARKALLVLLADQCEKLIDGEVLYHSDANVRLRRLGKRMPLFEQMALGVGVPDLYDELAELLNSCENASVPDGFRSRSARRWSQVVTPASCVPRISVTTLDFISAKRRRALAAAKSFVQRGGPVHD